MPTPASLARMRRRDLRRRITWTKARLEELRAELDALPKPMPTNNTRAKPVRGPDGRVYPSATEAALALGVSQSAISRRCKRGWLDRSWCWDEQPPAPAPDPYVRRRRYDLRHRIARTEAVLVAIVAELAALPAPLPRNTDSDRPVRGPNGRYASITQAAKAEGVCHKTIKGRCEFGHLGGTWAYEERGP